MIDTLDAPDPKERFQAVVKAGLLLKADAEELGISRLANALEHRIDDEDAEVRRVAIEAWAQLCHREVLVPGPGVARRIAARAEDPDDGVRAETAVALAILPPDASTPPARVLERLLGDASARVRREAAAAIGDVGDRALAGALAAHLEDSDEETRFEAAFALAALRDSRSLELLTKALGTSIRRLDACEGLKRLGSQEAVPALERAAKGLFVAWPERLTIWATLYSLGVRDSGREVVARTRARNKEERALALGLIGIHKIAEGAEILERVASDPRDRHQGTAVRALGDLGQASAASVLERIATDEKTPTDVRVDAVHSLARLESAGKSALSRLSRSSDPTVARAARELEAA